MTIADQLLILKAADRGDLVRYRPHGHLAWADVTPLHEFNFADHEYRIHIRPREWWIGLPGPDKVGTAVAYRDEHMAQLGLIKHGGEVVHVVEVENP